MLLWRRECRRIGNAWPPAARLDRRRIRRRRTGTDLRMTHAATELRGPRHHPAHDRGTEQRTSRHALRDRRAPPANQRAEREHADDAARDPRLLGEVLVRMNGLALDAGESTDRVLRRIAALVGH